MLESFVRFPQFWIPVVSIVCGTLVVLTAILAHQWRAARLAEVEASLKQDMLNRGLSAEDIERVIRAGRSQDPPPGPPEKPDPVSDNEYYLIEKLVEEERPIEEIERIIRAFKTPSGDAVAKAEPISENEYYLVEKLLEDERPVEEIERVIRALKARPAGARAEHVVTTPS